MDKVHQFFPDIGWNRGSAMNFQPSQGSIGPPSTCLREAHGAIFVNPMLGH